MTHDVVRNAIETRIAVLVRARNSSTDTDKRKAFKEAIDLLQNEVDGINIVTATQLNAKVDEIITRLKEIQDEKALDAGSALGRTIKKFQDLVGNPALGVN